MQGLITLDFGNTNPHAGLFQKIQSRWDLIKVVPLSELPLYLDQLGMSAHNSNVVVCEVRAREDEIQKLQESGFLVTRLSDYWRGTKFAGMPVQYAKTLGEDRLIEAFYSFKTHKKATLIIDSGTFVTIDVVSENGFLGGYIIPNINDYYSLFARGEQLKSVSPIPAFIGSLPSDTAQAMTEGYTAFAALVSKLIHEHSIQKIVLTGGHSQLWEKLLSNGEHQAILEKEPHFIHRALHYWMTTQIELL